MWLSLNMGYGGQDKPEWIQGIGQGTGGQVGLPGWTRTQNVQPGIGLEMECGLAISFLSSSLLPLTLLWIFDCCFALF